MLEESHNADILLSRPSAQELQVQNAVVSATAQSDASQSLDRESLSISKETSVPNADTSSGTHASNSSLTQESSGTQIANSSSRASFTNTTFQGILLQSPSSSQTLPPPPLPKSPVRDNHELHGPSLPPESVKTTPPDPSHPRPASAANSTSTHHRSLTISQGTTLSTVFITSALETIASSKEAKKLPELRDSVQHALSMIKVGQGGDRPREIFEPLRLACETRNEKLMIASLDCISKLISHSFFVENTPPRQMPTTPTTPDDTTPTNLADLVANTITAAYTESIPDPVSLQIVKALLALVLSPSIIIHHSSLLKAVRIVYNVFLLSQDSVNQMVAQGGLTQMINHVFSRCKTSGPSNSKINGSTESVSSSRRDSLVQSPRLPLVRSPQTESYIEKSNHSRSSVRTNSIESASETVSVSQTYIDHKEAEVKMSFPSDDTISEPRQSDADGTHPAENQEHNKTVHL